MKCGCPPHSPQLPVFCCKMCTEGTAQDSSRRVGSSGPRSGQVRGQRLCRTQVEHGEAAANDGSVAASPPRLHSALPPTITVCWTVFHSLSLCSSHCHSNLWSPHDSSQLSPFMPAHTVCLSFPDHGLLPAELSAVEGVSKQVSGLQ